jgi:hypothetical protein
MKFFAADKFLFFFFFFFFRAKNVSVIDKYYKYDFL